jgi:Protein of unknown function (DUF3151)
MIAMQNLMPEPPATFIPDDSAAAAELAAATDATLPNVAAHFPSYSGAWGALAARAFAVGETVTAYAFARTGYHRGLDQLRRSGWKGFGPVPWSHPGNRGFLQCLFVLGEAAGVIGESDEAARCAEFLRDCDPTAAEFLARV